MFSVNKWVINSNKGECNIQAHHPKAQTKGQPQASKSKKRRLVFCYLSFCNSFKLVIRLSLDFHVFTFLTPHYVVRMTRDIGYLICNRVGVG